jgi:hypothetical protein
MTLANVKNVKLIVSTWKQRHTLQMRKEHSMEIKIVMLGFSHQTLANNVRIYVVLSHYSNGEEKFCVVEL